MANNRQSEPGATIRWILIAISIIGPAVLFFITRSYYVNYYNFNRYLSDGHNVVLALYPIFIVIAMHQYLAIKTGQEGNNITRVLLIAIFFTALFVASIPSLLIIFIVILIVAIRNRQNQRLLVNLPAFIVSMIAALIGVLSLTRNIVDVVNDRSWLVHHTEGILLYSIVTFFGLSGSILFGLLAFRKSAMSTYIQQVG